MPSRVEYHKIIFECNEKVIFVDTEDGSHNYYSENLEFYTCQFVQR